MNFRTLSFDTSQYSSTFGGIFNRCSLSDVFEIDRKICNSPSVSCALVISSKLADDNLISLILDKASSNTLSVPDTCHISILNCEIKSSCLNCHGNMNKIASYVQACFT
ncbi:hypothetical protein AVEN_211-1 [Araneus ventricosus]|uniref:Uncharacterized protein n=1 Tax=Araneus ventricosus TaxID=182803 RepID=A0A4Y2PRN4_ARAVE|nr:hypothetical protein AVEN_211-1 [Araneus ventricosus]